MLFFAVDPGVPHLNRRLTKNTNNRFSRIRRFCLFVHRIEDNSESINKVNRSDSSQGIQSHKIVNYDTIEKAIMPLDPLSLERSV